MTNKQAQALGRRGGQKHDGKKTMMTIKKMYGENHYKNIALRGIRLKKARAIATHTKEEWEELKKKTGGRCVICWEVKDLIPDHIIPIYQTDNNPSDGIGNIQPVCKECNSRKGADNTNWMVKRGLIVKWVGVVKNSKVFFKCPSCEQPFETTAKLLADVGNCPKCNTLLNADNKVIIKDLTA
jgi:hypothetical protein